MHESIHRNSFLKQFHYNIKFNYDQFYNQVISIHITPERHFQTRALKYKTRFASSSKILLKAKKYFQSIRLVERNRIDTSSSFHPHPKLKFLPSRTQLVRGCSLLPIGT